MALAYAFAKCGMFSRRSGGMGGMPSMPLANRGILWQLYLWYFLLIANVAIAISAVGYGAELMDATMTPLGICIATIVVLCGSAQ